MFASHMDRLQAAERMVIANAGARVINIGIINIEYLFFKVDSMKFNYFKGWVTKACHRNQVSFDPHKIMALVVWILSLYRT